MCSMISEQVKELKDCVERWRTLEYVPSSEPFKLLKEAADTIEALSAKLAVVKEIDSMLSRKISFRADAEYLESWRTKDAAEKLAYSSATRMLHEVRADIQAIFGEYLDAANMERSERYFGGEWILADDMLPTEDGTYYVTYSLKEGRKKAKTHTGFFVFDSFQNEFPTHKTIKVLAWMPLPNPYKPDGEVGGMNKNEAIERHMAENQKRIDTIHDFMCVKKENYTKEARDNVYILETANKALAEIQQYRAIGTTEQFASYKAMFDDEMYRDRMLGAIGRKMTDELSEYKSIGTPEEFKAYREICEPQEISQIQSIARIVRAKGTVGRALDECAEYESIGTPDECRAAVEKQRAKKPIKEKESRIRYTASFICPSCGGGFSGTGIADYCYHCGQALSWEGENEKD